ncbi:MAG: hypothetical protein WC953_06200 [Pseudomonas sp.]
MTGFEYHLGVVPNHSQNKKHLVILGESRGSMGLDAKLQPLDSRVRGNDGVLALE